MSAGPQRRTLSCGLPAEIFDSLDGTNAEARRRIGAGVARDLWIVAGSQSGGRGRRGRTWISQPGNLYATRLIRPDCPPAQAAELSFVAALAVRDAVAGQLAAAAGVTCKWPNDVLINGRKTAGILLEGEGISGWIAVGIGINVAHAPEAMEFPATSIHGEGGAGDPDILQDSLATTFETWLAAWRDGGFGAILKAWRAVATGLGEPIRVRLEGRELHGRFDDIDDSGALILGRDDGGRERIAAGDVFFGR